jgi:hypothetical protein
MAERLTPTEAALRLGKTYGWVLRAVMQQKLQGGRDELGRWWISREGVEAHVRARHAEGTPAPAA